MLMSNLKLPSQYPDMFTSNTPNLEAIQHCVSNDMKAVDQVILGALHSEVALVNQIANYIIPSGGKRMRQTKLRCDLCQVQIVKGTLDQHNNGWRHKNNLWSVALYGELEFYEN